MLGPAWMRYLIAAPGDSAREYSALTEKTLVPLPLSAATSVTYWSISPLYCGVSVYPGGNQ